MQSDNSSANLDFNLKLLQQFFPHVYEWISPVSRTRTEPAIDSGTEEIYFTNKNHPQYHIVIGTSLSWMRTCIQSHQDKLYRLIWIEPDKDTFSQSLQQPDLASVLNESHLRIICSNETELLTQQLREDITAIGIWGLHVWVTQPYQNTLLKNELLQAIQSIEAVAVENAEIQYRQGPEVQRNIVANLPYIIQSSVLDQWKGRFANQPAVVVGAGPSLDKNIDELSKHKDRILIISVDTALKPLLNRGIEPGFVVTCDPTTLNTRHFNGIQFPSKTVLAYLPEIHRSILPSLRHNNLLCLHDANSKLLERLTNHMQLQHRFSRGMNVGFCAYSLSFTLGCFPIILTGMDLALSEENSSHAKGTANASEVKIDHEKKTLQLTNNVYTNESKLVETAGYFGGTVTTFPHFHIVLQRFVQHIARHQASVINATEGGAKIPGTSQRSLIHALQSLNLSTKPDVYIKNTDSKTQSIPLMVDTIRNHIQDLDQTKDSLIRGTARLDQWLKEIEANSKDMQTVQTQASAFFRRWQAIIHSPGLDESMDIGLAPYRFDTYRIEEPLANEPLDLARWWHRWLQSHFQALLNDVEIYRQLYANTLNSLILT